MSIKRIVLVFIILFSFVLNGWFVKEWVSGSIGPESKKIQQNDNGSKYRFLSRRILQDFPNDILINFLPLRKELQQAVREYGDSFGFYFEYLPTGTSIGVNQTGEFEAGSLFKVPVVMAYYHKRERLGLADNPIVTIGANQIDSGFGDLWKRGEGAQILLEDAARIALTDSDNTAIQIVAGAFDQQDLEQVYEGLDIDLRTQWGTTVITPKGYGSVLKALFFSAVLNKNNSEKILTILTKTKFADKLPAGLPQGIPVAHKIGVVSGRFYQDCGIVYVPRRPYLLCMVSASSEDEARIRMIDISKRVYKFVSSRK